MNTSLSDRKGIRLITITGRIDHEASRELQRQLGSMVKDGQFRLAADLSGVTYLNSAALGILVSTMKSARSRGGDLRLSGLKDSIMDLFRITRLSTIFRIYATVEEAVASFSEG